MTSLSSKSLAIDVYDRIKAEIFDFCLLPGDRFTETEVAARVGVSRTPVREALYRLQREGYIDVSARNGWSVRPFDFGLFENLYDVRVVLDEHKNVTMVARGPFLEIGRGQVAYVVDGDLALRRAIRTGAVSLDKIEILDGLKPGEQIVVAGTDTFNEAERVVLSR